MHASPIPWDDVQLFLSLQRTRRLSLTGTALGCDTSTVSRRLVRLEEHLGVVLFDRTRDGLVPTAAARALVHAAEEMERASHRFTSELDGLEREVEGSVRLSVPPGVAESFLSPLLAPLHARHPGLRFVVDASVRQADLSRREADLAIRTIKPTGGPLVRQLLTRAQWKPMGSPEVVSALGRIDDWNEVTWIGFGAGLEHLHVAKWLAARVKREPVLLSNSFQLQVNAVQHGLGVMIAPEPYAPVLRLEPLQLSRKLAAEVKTLPVDELWLVTHEALRKVPRVAATWDFIAQAIR